MYIKNYKRMPESYILCKYMDCDNEKLNKIIDDLVIQGKLKKEGNKYIIPGRVVKENIELVKKEIEIPVIVKTEKKEELKELPIEINPDKKEFILKESPKEILEEEKDVKKTIIKKYKTLKENKKLDMNMVFNIILFAVFIDFCYIGIKYNYYGNLNFKDHLDALTCAIAFMLASIIFFKKAIETLINKKSICIIYFVIYLLLFCYNTGTVLQYQFDKYQDKLYSVENIKTLSEKNKDVLTDKKIKIIEDELKNIEKEKLRQETILSGLSKEDEKYNFYYWNINRTDRNNPGFIKKIEIKNNELLKLYEDKSRVSESTVKTEKKKLFSGKLLTVYLFFPAFVIELLASITLVLLFRNKRKKHVK